MNVPDTGNKYTKMQQDFYDHESSLWSLENKDWVVGSFDSHNNWEDYNYLFVNVPNLGEKKMLDFGCGPGRNLVRFYNQFKQIDGVDMAPKNLENAKQWLATNNLPHEHLNFYTCNGVDLSNIPDNQYDVVMSTICLQHICVHEIRYNYFKEFLRVLRPNGYIALQMGYGANAPASVPYYTNHYDATGTNRRCDTAIEDVSQLEKDLKEIGFTNFTYHIRPVGPGDCHANWIYFNAQKPE